MALTLSIISFSTLHDDTLSHNFVKICILQGGHALKAHNEPVISSLNLNYIICKDPVSVRIRSVNIANNQSVVVVLGNKYLS